MTAMGARASRVYRDNRVVITQGASVVFQIDADGTVHAGGAAASQFVALANLVDARLSVLREWLNSHTHVETGGTTNAATPPLVALDSVAATKAKAT